MSRSVCNCMVGTPRCGVRTAQRAVPTLSISAVMALSDIRARASCDSNLEMGTNERNTRDQRSHQIRQVWPPCAKQLRIALRVICTNERPKLFLGKGQSAQR